MKPKLLSAGNPRIAKGDGDAPVQACIAAMPGWKRDIGEQLDTLINRTVRMMSGPRLLMRTMTDLPFFKLVTRAMVLHGSVLCAAVTSFAR